MIYYLLTLYMILNCFLLFTFWDVNDTKTRLSIFFGGCLLFAMALYGAIMKDWMEFKKRKANQDYIDEVNEKIEEINQANKMR